MGGVVFDPLGTSSKGGLYHLEYLGHFSPLAAVPADFLAYTRQSPKSSLKVYS